MGHLNSLALTALKTRVALTPQAQRREKLIRALETQLALASAEAEGRQHVVVKNAWVRDSDGNKTLVARPKRIKAWWWKDGDALAMVVRYGAKPLELAKGKRALRVENIAAVPATIQTCIEAVKMGELDLAIEGVLASAKAKQGKA
jgi:hypothetical protein